jgi:hypothetical protein
MLFDVTIIEVFSASSTGVKFIPAIKQATSSQDSPSPSAFKFAFGS